jgi:surfeit locus 1 family protein
VVAWFAERTFRPGLWPTLAVLALLPLLLWLGWWQLDRADQKQSLLASFAAGDQTATALSGGLDTHSRYTRVRSEGRFLTDRQILIDNMTREGKAGYFVLTPLVTESGAVLVNRGWIPKTFGKGALPDVAVGGNPRSVTGRMDHLPRAGLALAAEPLPQEWPMVMQFPTLEEIARETGLDLVPGMILLDDDQPDGYARQWKPMEIGPERHLGYAVQWFALALTLVIIWIVVNLRKRTYD